MHRIFPKRDPDVAVNPARAAPDTDYETRIRARLRKEGIGEETPEETIVAQRTPASIDRACKRENALGSALLGLARLLVPEPPY